MIHNLAWFDNHITNESYGLVVFQLQQIVISEELTIPNQNDCNRYLWTT